jgi:hypothetical protein
MSFMNFLNKSGASIIVLKKDMSMDFFSVFLKNAFSLQMLCFLLGFLINLKSKIAFPKRLEQLLIFYILFCIGMKGGVALSYESISSNPFFFTSLIGALVFCGFCQPLLSNYILKRWTNLDSFTIAAISASFGSVSVLTFVSATSFLEYLSIPYQKIVIPALTIMEVPAILCGFFMAKRMESSHFRLWPLIRDSIFNKSILTILVGFIFGFFSHLKGLDTKVDPLIFLFKPALSLFLLHMGLYVGTKKAELSFFSWRLIFFGIYMPVIGALLGMMISSLFKLDLGTATLVIVLTASSSYIAVPAAARMFIPKAKEAIYLPLSLGIAFPFNVLFGIPIYYYAASRLL